MADHSPHRNFSPTDPRWLANHTPDVGMTGNLSADCNFDFPDNGKSFAENLVDTTKELEAARKEYDRREKERFENSKPCSICGKKLKGKGRGLSRMYLVCIHILDALKDCIDERDAFPQSHPTKEAWPHAPIRLYGIRIELHEE